MLPSLIRQWARTARPHQQNGRDSSAAARGGCRRRDEGGSASIWPSCAWPAGSTGAEWDGESSTVRSTPTSSPWSTKGSNTSWTSESHEFPPRLDLRLHLGRAVRPVLGWTSKVLQVGAQAERSTRQAQVLAGSLAPLGDPREGEPPNSTPGVRDVPCERAGVVENCGDQAMVQPSRW